MIGTDHADLLIHKEFRKGTLKELVAVRSSFGWMIIGSCNAEVQKQLQVSDSQNCSNLMLKLLCYNKLSGFGKLIPIELNTQQNKT